MIERVRFIDDLDALGLPKEEYIIVGSAWLALLHIRLNNDIDLLISKALMDNMFGGEMPGVIQGTPFDIQGGHVPHPYASMFGAKDNDDVVYNYRTWIDGYPFIEFRFYRELKNLNVSDDECVKRLQE